jgi:hypothetical protein
MFSSLEGILIAILALLAAADGREGEPIPGAATASVQEIRDTEVSGCQRFSDEMIRQNCVARVAQREGKDIDAGSPFPTRVSWVAPVDPGMPDRNQFVRTMP